MAVPTDKQGRFAIAIHEKLGIPFLNMKQPRNIGSTFRTTGKPTTRK